MIPICCVGVTVIMYGMSMHMTKSVMSGVGKSNIGISDLTAKLYLPKSVYTLCTIFKFYFLGVNIVLANLN